MSATPDGLARLCLFILTYFLKTFVLEESTNHLYMERGDNPGFGFKYKQYEICGEQELMEHVLMILGTDGNCWIKGVTKIGQGGEDIFCMDMDELWIKKAEPMYIASTGHK